MKKKNIIISILTVINIFVIIIILATICKNQIFRRKYIRELIFKNENCKNYIMNIDYTDYEDERFNYKEKITCKDNVYKIEQMDNTTWYVDNNIISEKAKEIVSLPSKIYKSLLYESQIYSVINDADMEYKFIKTEEFNNNDCLVVEFKGANIYKYWIEKNTGIVLKKQVYDTNYKITEQYIYDVQINCVKEEDLILPDTSSYTQRDSREQNKQNKKNI